VKPIATRDLAHILSFTRELWERARGKRIFLTGATGFFGAWLLESLAYCDRELQLELGATVLCRNPETVASRMPHLARETSIRFVAGDIRSFNFPEQNYDFVIHAAAPTSGAEGCAAAESSHDSSERHRTNSGICKSAERRSFSLREFRSRLWTSAGKFEPHSGELSRRA
jgi:hypothetical protein